VFLPKKTQIGYSSEHKTEYVARENI